MLHWQISVAFYGASLCHRLKPGVPCSIDSETALRRNLQQKACCLDLWDLRVMMIVDTLLMCSHLKGACAGISENEEMSRLWLILLTYQRYSTIFNDSVLSPLSPQLLFIFFHLRFQGWDPDGTKNIKTQLLNLLQTASSKTWLLILLEFPIWKEFSNKRPSRLQ